MTSEQPHETDQKQSTGKPGAGCMVLLLLVLIGGSLVFYGFGQIWFTVSGFESRYVDAGYEIVEGNDLVFSEPIESDSYIYARHSILIEAGASANLALSSHEVVIKGIVAGDVAFLGGDIELAENAVIQGNLNVTMASNVVIRGIIQGEATGTWTRLYSYSDSAKGPSSGKTEKDDQKPQ